MPPSYEIALKDPAKTSGIGRLLVTTVKCALREAKYEYLEVKTLSASHPDAGYARTRGFYLAVGFRPVEELALGGPTNLALLMIKRL